MDNGMRVGVDGCSFGWIGVFNDGSRLEFELFPTAEKLLGTLADSVAVLIDIPIGLPDSRMPRRACDVEARRRLGSPRMHSVFPAPCRAALVSKTYEEAKTRGREELGFMPSIQAWCIREKVLEVNDLLLQNRKWVGRMRECHPELCFWGLAGGTPMRHRKALSEGIDERTEVLAHYCAEAPDLLDRVLRSRLRKHVSADDVLDALSAYVTASLPMASIPAELDLDAYSLPREIVYPIARTSAPTSPGKLC